MGKNLKGKELGKGLTQRADGRYYARFVTKEGERKGQYFKKLSDARGWLKNAQNEDKESPSTPFDVIADNVKPDQDTVDFSKITVNKWFDYWMDYIIPHLSWNTRRNYRDRYTHNIKPVIGKMQIRNVRPMHCQQVLMGMHKNYAGSTIRQAYITMGTMFKAALINDVISKHPMDGVQMVKRVKDPSEIKCLTEEEQEIFLEYAQRTHNYRPYRLVLETGLRIGELIGLTWDAIDFENGTLTVEKTMEYRYERGEWVAGSPKTVASYRTIPLTKCACDILRQVYEEKDCRKQSKELNHKLKYLDRRNGEFKTLDMRNLVFLNYRTGMPTKNSSYDSHLQRVCDSAGIKRISMHSLRHSYATRAIERGVNPKSLQRLLGHATLSTTMNKYVHVTDDFMREAVSIFESE